MVKFIDKIFSEHSYLITRPHILRFVEQLVHPVVKHTTKEVMLEIVHCFKKLRTVISFKTVPRNNVKKKAFCYLLLIRTVSFIYWFQLHCMLNVHLYTRNKYKHSH